MVHKEASSLEVVRRVDSSVAFRFDLHISPLIKSMID